MNFSCQNCNVVCEWESRLPVYSVGDSVEWKTIGNRFCNERECVEAEAKAHNLPVERVLEWHK